VEDGTVIAELAVVPPPDGVVNMPFVGAFEVAIGTGPTLGTAVETLTAIRLHIESEVFPPLEAFI
jgi:hypothetical protein